MEALMKKGSGLNSTKWQPGSSRFCLKETAPCSAIPAICASAGALAGGTWASRSVAKPSWQLKFQAPSSTPSSTLGKKKQNFAKSN